LYFFSIFSPISNLAANNRLFKSRYPRTKVRGTLPFGFLEGLNFTLRDFFKKMILHL